jgi:DNA-binding PadR family transcriptional regulator
MSLRYGLLGLLNYGSMTGYDLARLFKNSLSFFWQAKASQIYRELGSMEKDGWLSAIIEIQTDKPNRKVYSITESGRAAFQEWLAAPDEDIAAMLQVRSAFLMRVFFAGETNPDAAGKLISACRDTCRESLSKMEQVPDIIDAAGKEPQNASRSLYWRMTAFFGKSYYDSVISWSENMLKLIEDAKKGAVK